MRLLSVLAVAVCGCSRIPQDGVDEIEDEALPLSWQLPHGIKPSFDIRGWAWFASSLGLLTKQFVDGNLENIRSLAQELGCGVLGAAFVISDHLAGHAHELGKT